MNFTDYVKKGALLGLGAVMMTKEKAEALAEELVKKGEVTKDEGNILVKDLLNKAKNAEKTLEGKISTEIKNIVSKMGLASKKDVEKLREGNIQSRA